MQYDELVSSVTWQHMSSVHNATEHSYVKEQSKDCSFAISMGQSAPVERLSGRFLYLRQVQDANEIIVDHDPLRPVLSPALGLIHVDALYKLMEDGGRQRFHLHELPHRFQKLLLAESPVVLPVTLALQFLNVLFELLLFLVVPLGHFHKAFIRQLTRYIVLIDTFKQPVNFFIPGNQLLKVLPSVPALPLIVLGGFLSQQFGKFLGVIFQVADHAVEFQQYHLL